MEQKLVEEKVDYGYPTTSEDYNAIQAANPSNTFFITLPDQSENQVQFFKELDYQTGPHYTDYTGQEYIVDPEHDALKIDNEIAAAEAPVVENNWDQYKSIKYINMLRCLTRTKQTFSFQNKFDKAFHVYLDPNRDRSTKFLYIWNLTRWKLLFIADQIKRK